MSPMAVQQLESDLIADFDDAPSGVGSATRLVLHKKPKAFNAMTHGLSGQNIVLSAEELLHYAQMGLDFMRELEPVGARETSNAQMIFEGRWRLHRILSVENNMFCIERPAPQDSGKPAPGKPRTRQAGIAQQVNAFREDANQIELISRYENRLIRAGERLTDQLEQIQKRRGVRKPYLTFDESSSPVVIWYGKVLARAQALAAARRDYDNYLHATGAQQTDQSIIHDGISTFESTTQTESSFGKKTFVEASEATGKPKTRNHGA